MKQETNAIKVSIIKKADPVKEKVHFCYTLDSSARFLITVCGNSRFIFRLIKNQQIKYVESKI